MLEKAQTLEADEVFLDLEDAVAADAKADARHLVVDALRSSEWRAGTIAVRVNDWSTPWTLDDVLTVVGQAGDRVDCVILPKAESAHHVAALDLVLRQVERSSGLDEGAIG